MNDENEHKEFENLGIRDELLKEYLFMVLKIHHLFR